MHQLLLLTKQQDWKVSLSSSALPLRQNTLLQAEGNLLHYFEVRLKMHSGYKMILTILMIYLKKQNKTKHEN